MKNKKIFILVFVLLAGLTFITITEYNNTPEDEELSSGYSVVWWDMGKINNYETVLNYAYKSKKYALMAKDFTFYDEVEIEETNHYPQGICLTEDFVLVTAYAEEADVLGKIFVFDVKNGEYLAALGMDTKSHMGGIAFDGDNLWICNSSKMAIERIPYAMVSNLVKNNKGKIIDIRNMIDRYKVDNIPSCITFYDEQLWIATHSKITASKMVTYSFLPESNELSVNKSYKIPSKVQGIAFTELGEVYFSTSYGRKNSSHIKKYDSISEVNKNVNSYTDVIELPPCSEGIDYYNNKLYVVFESAGKKYADGTDGNGKCTSPLDKILIIYTK